MIEKDKKEFATLMMSLAEVFDSGKPAGPIKTEIYFKALEEYPIDKVIGAVSDTIRLRVFNSFPKPAEIIEAITGHAEERSLLAWQKVDRAVREVGPYASVKFDDPVIHSVVKFFGGWEKFCGGLESEWKWKQKDFERIYAILAKRDGIYPDYLPGITESHNKGKFDDFVPRPVLIGEQGQAQIEDKST